MKPRLSSRASRSLKGSIPKTIQENGFIRPATAGSVAQDEFTFFRRQNPPLSRRQIAEPEISDAHAQQAQRWMANGSSHAPYLPVFAFNQFQPNPAIGYVLAETDRWISGRDGALRRLVIAAR
jgi:hypothetical protein